MAVVRDLFECYMADQDIAIILAMVVAAGCFGWLIDTTRARLRS